MIEVRLNDGNSIPAVGFGVFQIPNDGPAYDAVLAALKAGYRHIDTAAAYMNESDVGKAVKDSGIDRSEIFITSKLWIQDYGYEAAKKGIETSLANLGTDSPADRGTGRADRSTEVYKTGTDSREYLYF